MFIQMPSRRSLWRTMTLRGGPLMVMMTSSGVGPAGIGASRRMAPKTKSSEPSKVALSAILSAEMPVTTVSCAPAAREREGEEERASRSTARGPDREELVGLEHQVERTSLQADREDEEREENAELLGAEPHREADPDLRPDDPADEQDQGQHHVDGPALRPRAAPR